MDASGGHESAYPRPATAWWGVPLFLTILVDPAQASWARLPRVFHDELAN